MRVLDNPGLVVNGLILKERLWMRAKVGDDILEFGSFDLLRALTRIRKRRDFWSNIYYQY